MCGDYDKILNLFSIHYCKWSFGFGIKYEHAEKYRALMINFMFWDIYIPIGNRSRRYSGLTDKVR